MQSSHFENLEPSEPYLTSFKSIEQEQKDFQEMKPYFQAHPFNFPFLNQSEKEMKELFKLRRHCNKPFEFRPRPIRDFHQLDQLEYLKQTTPENKKTMEDQAKKKYKLVYDYHKFPAVFHRKQEILYQEELERKARERYYPDQIYLPRGIEKISNYEAKSDNKIKETSLIQDLKKKKVNSK